MGDGGSGGVGGMGVAAMGGGSLTNLGTIKGGSGGGGGGVVVGSSTASGVAGVGGVGIYGANIHIVNSGTITGGMSGDTVPVQADAIRFTGGTNSLELQAGSVISGNVDATAGVDDTLALGGDTGLAATFDISKIVTTPTSGAADEYAGFEHFEKTGASTWTLIGANTTPTAWAVNQGTLVVGDAAHGSTTTLLGTVRVDSAGTLRGHGLVAGDVTNNGIVWPGGSIGTLTINGNYTQSPTGMLMIDVSPAGASQLNVGGTANLAGSLSLLYGPGTYTAKSYPIVTATHVNGTFGTVSGSAVPAGFTQAVSYAPGEVDLNLLGSGSSLGTPLVIAPANATIYGNLGASLLRASQHANAVLLDRLDGVCGPASEGGCARPGQRLWIQTEGIVTRVEGNRGALDVHDQRYGFLVGADRAFGPWTAGIAGGYSHSDLWESSDAASGKTDTARLALYGGRTLGRVNLSGTASYAYHFTSTQRDFPGFGQTKGDGHAQEFAAALQASVPFALGHAMTLVPHLGLRYAYVDGLCDSRHAGLAQPRDGGARAGRAAGQSHAHLRPLRCGAAHRQRPGAKRPGGSELSVLVRHPHLKPSLRFPQTLERITSSPSRSGDPMLLVADSPHLRCTRVCRKTPATS